LTNEDIQDLKNHIQQLRRKIEELTVNHKLTDPEVIGASQLLDSLLVEYEKMLIKKK
jgi:hypothetical protein